MLIFVSIGLLLIISTTSAMYPSSGDVVDLNESNFERLVIQSDNIWIVEFYAPWCGHCQQLVPEYSKAASGLKGIVKVGAVNADDQKSLGGQYGVKGFPTIKIFSTNKRKPEDYNGPRTAQGIADAAVKAVKAKIDAHLGGKYSSGGSGGSKNSGDDVIELTDSNFNRLVLESDDIWLVEFFAPWCGHCKNLAPHWADAATQLKGKVKLGALDATVHTVKANLYDIKGFPTIKYFGPGSKGSADDYDGGRTADDIVRWATEKHAENIPPPEVLQVITSKVLSDACEEHPLCVVAVLPHLLDCQSACRKDYITMLKDLGEKYKKKMWGWVWSEAVSQRDLEDSLGIGGFGYPALAVVNSKKNVYSILRGSFSLEGISEFLREVSYASRAVSTSPLKGNKLPKITTIELWDGKDGILPTDDDIDLSDIDLEDLKDEL